MDRHFMVADAKNRLVSGRKYSQMVLIEPELARDAEQRDVLVLKAPGMDELSVRLPRTEDMGAMQEETVDVGGWFLEISILRQSIFLILSDFWLARDGSQPRPGGQRVDIEIPIGQRGRRIEVSSDIFPFQITVQNQEFCFCSECNHYQARVARS